MKNFKKFITEYRPINQRPSDKIQNSLESELKRHVDILKSHPGHGSGQMGMTPDAVKLTPEWKEKKKAVDTAFRNLQNYNSQKRQ